ncbi:hypothetical protein PVK06_026769 [Gossypium arboreum]|uniref:Uncharacterized protein n=1 Tax=Gossypium arboreum TaxID=29729 RepID=A0ABR0NYK2_GOSAR|nr:hypothetical protein PVK06_026769 [Gossypium arboreum]
MGTVSAAIFMSSRGLSLYTLTRNKVEPWAELRGTTGSAVRYTTFVRPTIASGGMYEFLPTCEAIVAMELDCYLEYMPWFRVHGKLYLLGKEARGRQPHTRRPRQGPRHLRSDEATEVVYVYGTERKSECYAIGVWGIL